MTNAEPGPIPRDHAPADDDVREQIDALDEQAEAVVERETGVERADDVATSHPAPEPPD
jgi:hypothetical protein